MERPNKRQKNIQHKTKLKTTSVLETNKDKIQTWNHLAWRRDAKAVRHFCLSRTSGGSLTESESIGRWNKKTRYSLTKGSSVSRPGGTQAAFPNHRQEGEGEGDPSSAEPPNALNLPANVVLHGPAYNDYIYNPPERQYCEVGYNFT